LLVGFVYRGVPEGGGKRLPFSGRRGGSGAGLGGPGGGGGVPLAEGQSSPQPTAGFLGGLGERRALPAKKAKPPLRANRAGALYGGGGTSGVPWGGGPLGRPARFLRMDRRGGARRGHMGARFLQREKKSSPRFGEPSARFSGREKIHLGGEQCQLNLGEQKQFLGGGGGGIGHRVTR